MSESFKYVRLSSDESGESHFDEVEVPLELTDFAPPAEPLGLAPLGEASAVVVIEGDEGWSGEEPHPAPARQFMVPLTAAVEVTASDGEVRRIGQGDVLLLEDTEGRGHSTRWVEAGTFLVVRASA